MSEEAWRELNEIINVSIKEKRGPDDWHKGVVTPNHKQGDKRMCSSYRRITLSSILSKVLAQINGTNLHTFVMFSSNLMSNNFLPFSLKTLTDFINFVY